MRDEQKSGPEPPEGLEGRAPWHQPLETATRKAPAPPLLVVASGVWLDTIRIFLRLDCHSPFRSQQSRHLLLILKRSFTMLIYFLLVQIAPLLGRESADLKFPPTLSSGPLPRQILKTPAEKY